MMKRIFLFLTIFSGAFLTSCQDVVSIDLDRGNDRLVIAGGIEAVIGDAVGYQQITLTMTGDYFDTTATPRASGADVRVFGPGNREFIFTESTAEPGKYETTGLFANAGETWSLRINWQGDMYEGSGIIAAVPPIDSIYQKFVPESFFDDEGIRIHIDFADPADQRNFYMWRQYQDGESVILANPGTKFNILASDEFFNGQRVSGKVPDDELIYESGQVAEVRQIGLDEAAFTYWFQIYNQAGGGGLYSAPPAAIRGNVANISAPDNYPLGYFTTSQVSVGTLMVE